MKRTRTRKPRYWTHAKRPGQKFLGNYEWVLYDPIEAFASGNFCIEKQRIFKLKNAKTGREINLKTVQNAKAKGWKLK